jgi:hypothetical protein
MFRALLSPLLRSFKIAVERYLRGHGHPMDPSFAGLISSDDTPDEHYRARRFVKVLSGVNLLPSTGHTFKVLDRPSSSELFHLT